MDGIATLLYIVLMLVTVVSAIFYVINRVGAASHYRQFKKTQKPVRELTEAERNLLEVHYSQRLRDNGVYELSGRAKLMTLTTNGSTEQHLSIAGVDIRMFPHWRALSNGDANRTLVAMPRKSSVLLPLEFNGVSLAEAMQSSSGSEATASAQPGITGSREETKTESALRQIRASSNVGWVIGLCIALLCILHISRLPGQGQLLALPFVALAVFSAYQLLAHWQTPKHKKPAKLHTLAGALSDCKFPPALGISMRFAAARIGTTEVYYPKLWLPLIKQQPEQIHHVEIDMTHQVVRHDGLSLYDTLRAHPRPRWGHYLAIVLGSAALLGLALLLDPSPLATLQVASRQLDGQTRQLQASSPAELLAQAPKPGDWVTLKGAVSCMTGGTFGNEPIHSIDRGERLQCTRLGWNNAPLHIDKLALNPQEAALVGLLHQLRADHRLFEHDYPYAQPFARRGDKPGTFVLQDLNRLLLALDSICHGAGLTCPDLKQHMTQLVASDNSWPALLAQAQQGSLPAQVTINREQLDDLGDFLSRALRYRVRGAALRDQYTAVLADYTPALVLQRIDHDFRFSAGSYAEGPFTRHATSLVSAYMSAAMRQRMAALERRQRREHIQQRRRNPQSTTQKLMNLDLTFHGRIRRIGDYHGQPMLTLKYNRDFEAPSLFHLATAPLMMLFAVLFGIFGLLGLITTLRRKRQRDEAARKYIRQRLQRPAQF